jgi:rhodanese-related sulfurtransferase
MTDQARKTLLGIAGIVAAGLVIGVANNTLAGKTRQLEWDRDYPPKKIRPCSERTAEEDAALTAAQQQVAGGETPIETAVTTPAGTAPAGPAGPSLEAVPAPAGESGPGAATAPTMPSAATGPDAPTSSTASTGPAGPAGPATPATATAPPAATGAAGAAGAAGAPSPSVTIPEVPPGASYLELAPAQIKALYDQGALFVDARLTALYQEGHVKGALSIPVWESGVDEKVAQVPFETEGDMSRPIVAYCGGGDCEDSHTLATKIFESGYPRVYVYKDGFPNWAKNGWPASTGDAR